MGLCSVRRFSVAAIALGTALGLVSHPAAQRPSFTTGVALVRLDVSVLDRSRHPVTGLTANDFVVKEDGRPRSVAAFAEIRVPDAGVQPARWLRDASQDVTTNRESDGRLIVLLLDDRTVPFDPYIITNAKRVAKATIERLGPKDAAAVVFTRDNRGSQDFTTDRSLLLAAIDRFSGGYSSDAVRLSAADWYLTYLPSIRVLGNTLQSLLTIKDRRKAILYVSTGVPVDQSALSPGVHWGATGNISDRESGMSVSDAVRGIFQQAAQANVTIYSVDPAGLAGTEFYLQNKNPSHSNGTLELIHKAATLRLNYLETVAADTGGTALLNTNDFGPGLDQIFRETGDYYLLGIEPWDSTPDGKLRRIQVSVTKPHMTVQNRQGYYGIYPAPKTAIGPVRAGDAALTGFLPATGIQMRVSTAAFRGWPDPSPATVVTTVGIERNATAGATTGKSDTGIEIVARLFSVEGQELPQQRQTCRVSFAAGQTRAQSVTSFRLPPGRYELRASAHDPLDDTSGSVYATIDVPDLRLDRVSMSGILLTQSHGDVPAKSTDPLFLSSVLPTTRRDYDRSDFVRAVAQLYVTGQSNVSVSATMLAANGETVLSEPVAETTGGTMDLPISFQVPLSRLSTGDCLLILTATINGQSVSQQTVRLSVH